tara:strand:+ start:502 stop:708 length:207 start_codon:yes stop_codon:yes gene_type:complete
MEEKEKIKNIIEDYKNKSNNEIAQALTLLKNNFDDTKKLVVDLTYRLDSIESKYNTLNTELKKRIKDV